MAFDPYHPGTDSDDDESQDSIDNILAESDSDESSYEEEEVVEGRMGPDLSEIPEENTEQMAEAMESGQTFFEEGEIEEQTAWPESAQDREDPTVQQNGDGRDNTSDESFDEVTVEDNMEDAAFSFVTEGDPSSEGSKDDVQKDAPPPPPSIPPPPPPPPPPPIPPPPPPTTSPPKSPIKTKSNDPFELESPATTKTTDPFEPESPVTKSPASAPNSPWRSPPKAPARSKDGGTTDPQGSASPPKIKSPAKNSGKGPPGKSPQRSPRKAPPPPPVGRDPKSPDQKTPKQGNGSHVLGVPVVPFDANEMEEEVVFDKVEASDSERDLEAPPGMAMSSLGYGGVPRDDEEQDERKQDEEEVFQDEHGGDTYRNDGDDEFSHVRGKVGPEDEEEDSLKAGSLFSTGERSESTESEEEEEPTYGSYTSFDRKPDETGVDSQDDGDGDDVESGRLSKQKTERFSNGRSRVAVADTFSDEHSATEGGQGVEMATSKDKDEHERRRRQVALAPLKKLACILLMGAVVIAAVLLGLLLADDGRRSGDSPPDMPSPAPITTPAPGGPTLAPTLAKLLPTPPPGSGAPTPAPVPTSSPAPAGFTPTLPPNATPSPTLRPSQPQLEWQLRAGPFGSTAENSDFGASVSMANGVFAVGAPLFFSGAVQTFRRDGNTWNSFGSVIESGATAFGASVDIQVGGSRTSLVVGAPETTDNVFAQRFGAAYAYELVGDVWNQVGDVIVPGVLPEEVNGMFASAVAMASGSSMRVCIGAPESNLLSEESAPVFTVGRVYAFEYTGSSWERMGDPIVGATDGTRLGTSVDMSEDGTRILMGAPGLPSGGVLYYEWDGTKASWNVIFSTIGNQASESMGSSVAIISSDGNLIAVGSPQFDRNRGAVRVYARRPLGGFVQVGPDILGAVTNDALGTTLAGSNQRVVVGTSSRTFHVYEYNEDADVWQKVGLGPNLGSSVASIATTGDASTVVVGLTSEEAVVYDFSPMP